MRNSRAFITGACLTLLLAGSPASRGAEGDALAILANIRARHLPFGAILDPIFTLTNSDQIANYTRCGDSALWTGHYLAAEAFRYKVTQSPDALNDVRAAIAALKGLADVTGTNLLARCMVPVSSPFAASISSQEASNGIDYILPYWMARYSGLQESTVVQLTATAVGVVASGSLASIYGAQLASTIQQAFSLPLPPSLGGVSLTVQDAAGNSAAASLLYVSPGQINFLVPPGLASGVAKFTIANGAQTPVAAIGAVGQVAPTLFSIAGTGPGLAAPTAVRIGGNPATSTPVSLFNCISLPCQALLIDVSGSAPVYLTLYGTGIRNRSSLDNVLITINGVSLPAVYAGAQPTFAGLDQINVRLTPDLRGSGLSNVVVKVDQHQANTVTVNIQ